MLRAATQPVVGVAEALIEPWSSRAARRMRTFGGERVHLGVRGLHGAASAQMAQALERRLAEVPGVVWVAANAVLETVIVATEGPADDESTLRALLDVVEAVERSHAAADAPLPAHPASVESTSRAAWSVTAQAAALPLAVLGRLTRSTPLVPEFAALVTIVDTQPRLRRMVERMVGQRNAHVVLATVNAVAQASAGGYLGLTVDTVRDAMRMAEARAHRTAWIAAEPDITGASHLAGAELQDRPPRPVPLRSGAAERYADMADVVAGATFVGALVVTRSPVGAARTALSAIPKAPWLAREGFTCTLGGALAHRGTVVRDPQVLRKLDRIGTLLLDAEALTTGAHVLADLIPLDDDTPAGELAATAHRLFDPVHPQDLRRNGSGKENRAPGKRTNPPRRSEPYRSTETERGSESKELSGSDVKDRWTLGPLDRLTLRHRTTCSGALVSPSRRATPPAASAEADQANRAVARPTPALAPVTTTVFDMEAPSFTTACTPASHPSQ